MPAAYAAACTTRWRFLSKVIIDIYKEWSRGLSGWPWLAEKKLKDRGPYTRKSPPNKNLTPGLPWCREKRPPLCRRRVRFSPRRVRWGSPPGQVEVNRGAVGSKSRLVLPHDGEKNPTVTPGVHTKDLRHPLKSKRAIVAPKKKAISAPYVTRKGFPSKSFEPFLGRRVLVVTSRRRTSLKRDPLAPYPTQYWRVNRLKEQMGPLSATKSWGRPLLRSRWGFDSTKLVLEGDPLRNK